MFTLIAINIEMISSTAKSVRIAYGFSKYRKHALGYSLCELEGLKKFKATIVFQTH